MIDIWYIYQFIFTIKINKFIINNIFLISLISSFTLQQKKLFKLYSLMPLLLLWYYFSFIFEIFWDEAISIMYSYLNSKNRINISKHTIY